MSGTATARDVLRTGLGLTRPGRLALAALGYGVHQAAEVAVPVLVGVTIDRAVTTGSAAALTGCLLALLGVFVVLVGGWRTGALVGVALATDAEHELRLRLVRAGLLSPAARPEASGVTVSVATVDVERVGDLSVVLARAVSAVVALLVAAGALLSVSWVLALVVLVTAAVQAVLVPRLGGPLEERVRADQAAAGEATATAADLVEGLRVLQGLGVTAAAAERYTAASRRSLAAARRRLTAQTSLAAVGDLAAGVCFVLVVAVSGWLAASGRVAPGQLVAVVGVAALVVGPLQGLGVLGVELAAARGAAGRIAERLADAGPPAGAGASTDPRPCDEPAAAHRLSVDVAGTSVTVAAGRLVGLVVPGPTTLDLLDRLGGWAAPDNAPDDAPDGAPGVRVDGAPVTVERLRALVYTAPVEDRVFSGSLADNLVAPPDADLLAVAGADDVVAHLGGSLDAPVGEQGRRLSGGQRQRLLLARALHRPQRLLVLHEPVSSVDTVTAGRVADALRAHAERTGRGVLLLTASPVLLGRCHDVHTVEGA